MLTLLTIFIAVAGAGFAFWFYNKRQIKNLSEQIYDKNAVISALKNHVEPSSNTELTIESTIAYVNPNNEWRGNSNDVNLTPTVEEALSKKKKPRPNKNGNGGKQIQDARAEFSSSEKKNRPKPRKPKTQQ
jgi:flagellar basal body-associated protein FliL